MKIQCMLLSMCFLVTTFYGQHDRMKGVMRGAGTIYLLGRASGGMLTLVGVTCREVHYVTIATEPNEEAASVAPRLAKAVNNASDFEFITRFGKVSAAQFSSLEAAIGFRGETKMADVIGGPYLLAGRETGLRIPKPPTCLSGAYDEKQEEVVLTWVEPEESPELKRVFCEAVPVVTGSGEEIGDGNLRRTRWVVSESEIKRACKTAGHNPAAGLSFHLVFYGLAPSNAAVIFVKGRVQESLLSIPFTSGIAPNWTGWKDETTSGMVKFEQGKKPGMDKIYFSKPPEGKPFYQRIRGSGSRFAGGVWRKFLGLKSGHTYKVSVRVNTFSGSSFFSVMAGRP